MKTIKLKSISLVNFKGVRDLNLNFTGQVTVVSGGNGTGKTTVFDAFLWLLFGKDSTGRSDNNFQIKTLDPVTGKPILRLEHSVTGVLDVNGREVKLQRCFTEKWFKPSCSTEEKLKNHETTYFVNDVKLATKREYEAEIAAILPEEVFKMVTNPFYFNSLKPEMQKQILLDMAGNVTDEEVAALKPEYLEMLDQLSGRSLEKFAKEVAAKKKACNEILAVIPSQIETAQKLMPESENWEELEKELQSKKDRLKDYDAQIADKSRLNEADTQRKINIQKEIGSKRIDLANRENAIRAQAEAGKNEALMKTKELEFALRNLQGELQRCNTSIQRFDVQIREVDKELDILRSQYRAISAEQLEYPDGAFICPTCKRPLEVEDIERKQAELSANFNQQKAARIKDNKANGMAKKTERENILKSREDMLARVADLEQQIGVKNTEIEAQKANIPETPNVELLISSDQSCIDLENAILDLENQMKVEAKVVDISELTEAKAIIEDNIQALISRLSNREHIEKAQKEIKVLEDKRLQNNQAKANCEKWEAIALEFQKDKDNKLMERINGMFKIASFSFLTEHLNGNEKVTCVCTVDGTPYPDVNSAGKINAGIDIINALCVAKGVSAPIFIDNRESVNEIIPTVSQVINLVVSKEKKLTIK